MQYLLDLGLFGETHRYRYSILTSSSFSSSDDDDIPTSRCSSGVGDMPPASFSPPSAAIPAVLGVSLVVCRLLLLLLVVCMLVLLVCMVLLVVVVGDVGASRSSAKNASMSCVMSAPWNAVSSSGSSSNHRAVVGLRLLSSSCTP